MRGQEDFEYINKVYDPDILSVKWHIEGLPTSEPIINLSSQAKLLLTFDDLLGGAVDYTYSIIHCDKDWRPSSIPELDYLDGFNNERIEEYEYSHGTKYDYTHYKLSLPNDDTGWLISGNYLLIIRNQETEEVILTRRFMVADELLSVGVDIKRSRKMGRLLKDQELELAMDMSHYPVQNPQSELYITILQNGRWDNSIKNIQPRFTLGSVLQFDRAQPLSLPAYNEFRNIDARTYLTRGFGVEYINIAKEEIDLYLFADTKREDRVTNNLFEDINGQYIIVDTIEHKRPGNIYGDYLNLHFALYSPSPIYNGDIYIIGSFNDWEPKEEFRLTYDPKDKLYKTTALLKQGYYDYQYVIVKDNNEHDIEALEGSYYATQNQYHILVYQRKFGERYDRLIAVRSLNTTF